jgi:hypothetical protein
MPSGRRLGRARSRRRTTVIRGRRSGSRSSRAGLRFWLDGSERIARPGDEVAVGKGIYHDAHNPFDERALVVRETRAALRSAEPLTEASAILREFKA